MTDRYIIDSFTYSLYVIGKIFENSNEMVCRFETRKVNYNFYTCETGDGKKFRFTDASLRVISRNTGNDFTPGSNYYIFHNRNLRLKELVKELEDTCSKNVCYITPDVGISTGNTMKNLYVSARYDGYVSMEENDDWNLLITSLIMKLNAKVLWDDKFINWLSRKEFTNVKNELIRIFGENNVYNGSYIELDLKYKIGVDKVEYVMKPWDYYILFNGERIDQTPENRYVYEAWKYVLLNTGLFMSDIREASKGMRYYTMGEGVKKFYEGQGLIDMYLRSVVNAKVITEDKDLQKPLIIIFGQTE